MSTNETDDDVAAKLLSLRELGPSAEARLRYRRAVAYELNHAEVAETRPWWTRSISIPVPVFMAACLAAVFGIGFHLRHEVGDSAFSTMVASPEQSVPVVVPTEQPLFEMTEVYLCGVGRIETSTFSLNESPTVFLGNE
ncbi:MAG: hypothetical protein AAGD07_25260 [Planctomycetota bacterium]